MERYSVSCKARFPTCRSKVQVKFRLPSALHRAVQAQATKDGVSVTQVLNTAVTLYLDSRMSHASCGVGCVALDGGTSQNFGARP